MDAAQDPRDNLDEAEELYRAVCYRLKKHNGVLREDFLEQPKPQEHDTRPEVDRKQT